MARTPSKAADTDASPRFNFDDPPRAEWLAFDPNPLSHPSGVSLKTESFEAQFSKAVGNHIVEYFRNPIVNIVGNNIDDGLESFKFSGLIVQTYYFIGRQLYELSERVKLDERTLEHFNKFLNDWRLRLIEKLDFFHDLQRNLITEFKTDESIELTDAERWALVDEFAAKYPGAPVSAFAQLLFSPAYKSAENSHPAPLAEEVRAKDTDKAPKFASRSWADRETDDTPVSFIRKHYGTWRNGAWDRDGLTKADIRGADFQLYNALATWERRHPEDVLNLPTKKEVNDVWVDRVMRGEQSPQSVLELERFAAAARRRGLRDSDGRK